MALRAYVVPEKGIRATVTGIRETGVYVVQGQEHVGYRGRSICGAGTRACGVQGQEHMWYRDRVICGRVTGAYVGE